MSELLDGVVLSGAHLIERWDRRRSGGRARRQLSPAGLAPGVLVAGRYRLSALLGEGGMGQVWLADDQLEKRTVALKSVRAELRQQAGEAAGAGVDLAFQREFYTMTKLQHPNTVKVYDYGLLPNGDRFLSMEVVKGKDLEEMLRRGPLELKQLYRVLLEMANVLGFIHSRLFVHCDIKSGNVRLTDRGAVKLMDFGLMHQLGLPAGGMLKGTPAYMAPEIPRGGSIDARTDLYSLGVLAFELATGRYPFEGRSIAEVLGHHLNSPPPRLSALRQVPEPFERLVAKLLAKEPRDRHQSAGELIRDLSELSGISIQVEDYSARTSYLNSAELIGRGPEQTALRDALRAVQEQRGRSVFVTAPAGVGKTRLLQEFRLGVKIADVPFLVGQSRAEGQLALGPLVEALSQLVPLSPQAALDRYGPLLSRILPVLVERGYQPPLSKGPAADKPLLFEALRGWLRETAAVQPFILCLEDLHWADSATFEFTNVIIRELVDQPAMVVATFRSDEVDRFSTVFQTVDEGLTRRLELGLLSESDAQELVANLLGASELPPQFAARLHAATGGNAFFLTETLRALVERETLVLQSGRWVSAVPAEAIDLPPTAEKVVELRLASLAPRAIDFCRRIAPLGRMLDLRVVERIAQLPEQELFPLLDELVERQFVQRVDRDYYFAHDKVRQGIYRSTSEADCKQAHLRIGEALEQLHARDPQSHAAVLGYHFARSSQPSRAIEYLRTAGERAIANQGLREGAQLLFESANLLEASDLPNKQQLLLTRLERLVRIAVYDNPLACAEGAGKLLDALEKRLDPAEGFRHFNALTERLATKPGLLGRRKLRRMWREQPLDPRSRDPLHLVPRIFIFRTIRAFALGVLSQTPKALEIINRQLADNPNPGALRAAAQVSRSVGLTHMGLWAPQQKEALESIEWFERHLERVGDLPERLRYFRISAYYWAAIGQAFMGRELDPAIIDRGVELAAQEHYPDLLFFFSITRLIRAAICGDPDGLQRRYAEVSDVVRRMGQPRILEARMWNALPEYYLQRGDKEMSAAAIDKLVGCAGRDPWLRRWLLVYRASYAAAFEDAANIDRAIDAAVAGVKEVPSFSQVGPLLCVQSSVHLARGQVEAARAVAEQAHQRAVQAPTACPVDEIRSLQALGEALGGEAGISHLERSAELARQHGHGTREALADLSLAKLWLPVDRARAACFAGRAEEGFNAVQAAGLVARVEAFRRKAAGVG